jgi:hypothetical protein
VQQRGLGVRVKPLSELLERLAGGSRGDLGVDLHRDGDLAMPQDLHREARMHVERSQQRAACLAGAVHGDRGDLSDGNASGETAVEVPRSASCCCLRILSAVTHRPGRGRGASDVSVLTSRRRSWPPTRWSCSPTYNSAESRSTSSQVSPSTSPLRRPRTRIRTKAGYRASPACQADSRNQRASSTVQAPRFRRLPSRRFESLTANTGFRLIISSSTAQVSAARSVSRASLRLREEST